ncbi:hypothetical protein L7F22_012190 [Adiantum nelumboides]|nr:hypothetical protein [Adiantum nelumboides]
MCDVLGVHGIFASDGHIWLKQRKLASQIFSVNNFRTHVQSTVVREIQTLDKLLQDASKKDFHVNFPDAMFRFTLISFALMAFDADIDCLPTSVEGLSVPNEFAGNFDYAQMVMDHRIFMLLPKWSEWLCVERHCTLHSVLTVLLFPLPSTREGFHMRKALRSLNQYCYRIIDSRLARRVKAGGAESAADKTGKDLLELFMDRGLTREELLPVILNFLIAGRDTTAQSLAWLFYELWKRPESVWCRTLQCLKPLISLVSARHIEQIRQASFRSWVPPTQQQPLRFEEMKDLPFLQACFYESVRVSQSIP